MKIYKAKASNYNSVDTKNIISYIKDYNSNITHFINNYDLSNKDRTQLKAIAADLETVKKRLNYLVNNLY